MTSLSTIKLTRKIPVQLFLLAVRSVANLPGLVVTETNPSTINITWKFSPIKPSW